MAQPIMGNNFCALLIKGGIEIPEMTRRIVIDIPCDGCVMVYYETYADKNVLDVVIESLIVNKDKIVVVKHKKTNDQ